MDVRAGNATDPWPTRAVPTTSEGARTRFAQKSALGTGKQRDTLDNEFAELFRLRIGIITRQESDAEAPRQKCGIPSMSIHKQLYKKNARQQSALQALGEIVSRGVQRQYKLAPQRSSPAPASRL